MNKFIEEFIIAFENCEDSDSAIEFMVETQQKTLNLKYKDRTGAYIFENYYIQPSFTPIEDGFYKDLEKNLGFINSNNLCPTSAPRLVKIVSTKEKIFTAIIFEINDTKDGELIPYLQTKDVPMEKIKEFKKEQLELLDKTGLYNPIIFNDINNFYTTFDTKNIVFGSWDKLLKVENEAEKSEVKNKFEKLL